MSPRQKVTPARVEPLAVTVREAAALIGLGKDAVYALVKSGRLPHLMAGERIVIPLAGLRRWVEANTIGGTAAPTQEVAS